MTKRQIRRFFNIPQVIFLQYFLLMGLVNFLFSGSNASWQGSLIFGAFVGGVATWTILKGKAKRYAKYKLTEEQFFDMDEAVQTGKLPKDKKVRAALPAYLDERMKWYTTQRVKAYSFCFILAGLIALWGVLAHDLGLVAIAIILFAMTTAGYSKAEKLPGSIKELREQL